MVWFAVDDSFSFHPKVIRAGNAALGLWARAGAWSAQQLTDGYIDGHLALAMGTPVEIDALVTHGLWTVVEGGFQFKDWHHYNPSAEEVEHRKMNSRNTTRRWREKKKEQEALEPAGDTSRDTSRDTGVTLPPTPPLPSPISPSERSAARGATRIPEPFIVTKAMREWAAEETPDVNVDAVTREFVDFWRAATKNATKKDWVATWRNRMRAKQGDLAASKPKKFTPRPYTIDESRL